MEKNQIVHPCDNCGKIISSQTLPLSSGTTITPYGINGPLVAKIPVVLGEREIQIDVEAVFKLNEPFFEIKRIKKDVFLTQCKLLPRSGAIAADGTLISGKLFISGFVRKNIEYATADCVEKEIVSGRIAHTTIEVPFTAVTEVVYAVPPVVNASSGDSTTFTESPYCELEGVRIFEDDINTDPLHHKTNSNVQLYNKVTEKMVIYIRLKVLQLQQVNIEYIRYDDSDCDE
ncbi:CsxC family protein [Clostridium algoriphilum]|uniref:CsxC family protein n=1 Tax=Clostridium algoriphilum TaxID=198347 RepID=UPI00299DD52E|nr:hypothetical protein [Clostridium algoriphilum]